jgi:uncharacterized protein (TIGR02300 family)
MATAEARKKMRGTKRVCRSCAVPFYDLSRDPIVCPACGAHYTLDAQAAPDAASAPASARKPAWSGGFKRQHPPPATADEPTVSEIAAPTNEGGEEAEAAADAVHDEDVDLEQEQDDADISGLLDREDVEDGGER